MLQMVMWWRNYNLFVLYVKTGHANCVVMDLLCVCFMTRDFSLRHKVTQERERSYLGWSACSQHLMDENEALFASQEIGKGGARDGLPLAFVLQAPHEGLQAPHVVRTLVQVFNSCHVHYVAP